jgi:hypothetical protein
MEFLFLNYVKLYRRLRGGFWTKITLVGFGGPYMSYWVRGPIRCKYKYIQDKTEFYR